MLGRKKTISKRIHELAEDMSLWNKCAVGEAFGFKHDINIFSIKRTLIEEKGLSENAAETLIELGNKANDLAQALAKTVREINGSD